MGSSSSNSKFAECTVGMLKHEDMIASWLWPRSIHHTRQCDNKIFRTCNSNKPVPEMCPAAGFRVTTSTQVTWDFTQLT